MKRPLGAQISHMLKDRGVDTIFGIPGVHNVEMYRGIEEVGITHVLARHEQGAGFMADGYARATGKPGVAYVITGPGVCNIMTPMGQAYSDSVPMLVISSCLDETAARRGQLHQMKDQQGAAACVCDWSEEARSASAAYQLIDRAFDEFAGQRKRPKHIQVPIELGGRLVDGPPPAMQRGVLPAGNLDAITAVAEQLKTAKRPLFVFGGGAAQSLRTGGGAFDWVSAFVAHEFASFTSYAGRGVIPAGAPYHFGASLSKGDSAEVFAKADLVIAVGTELAEVDIWRAHLGQTCPLVRIDIDPEVFSDGQGLFGKDICVLGDASAQMTALLQELGDGPQSSDWDVSEIANLRSQWRSGTDADRPGIVPIAEALQQALPADTMIYSDMTQFAYVAKDVWDMPGPNLWHHPFGFGTLGYALPAAIGGKIGLGDRPVVAIAGDYGFQYTVQELGVAVELGLGLPIILWDNGKLKEIEDAMVNSQIAPNAVIAQNPDFCKLAEAWGAKSTHPKSLTDLQNAVRDALAADLPTLIYVTPEILR